MTSLSSQDWWCHSYDQESRTVDGSVCALAPSSLIGRERASMALWRNCEQQTVDGQFAVRGCLSVFAARLVWPEPWSNRKALFYEFS